MFIPTGAKTVDVAFNHKLLIPNSIVRITIEQSLDGENWAYNSSATYDTDKISDKSIPSLGLFFEKGNKDKTLQLRATAELYQLSATIPFDLKIDGQKV